ncbi:MAG: DUF2892 domain-containing protein [DPANN group archaeon]|nr:DUF2892 domain-containing protein [DPANN group archaeon]
MTKNMSQRDRAIRIIIGAVILPSVVLNAPFSIQLTGTAYMVGALFGVLLLVTGAMGTCPVYGLLKKKTQIPTKPVVIKAVAVKKTVRKPVARKTTRAPAKRKAPARKKVAPRKKK